MTPHLVQEALPRPKGISEDQFVFLVCQHGAEPTIKRKWLGDQSPFRLAFSRPGLLTFKYRHSLPTQLEAPLEAHVAVPEDWLIRLSGIALGQFTGPQAESLVEQTLELAGGDWDAIHVFQRDSRLPGMHGYEPGSTELTTEIGQLFKAKLCGSKIGINVNNPCELGAKILDVVLVEPDHWIIGYHIASHVSQCWPGGTYPVATPNPMVSRAYLKMAESIAWAGFPMEVGDAIVELGSAPGGSCQRLLDLGLAVTGIDPAPMAPLLMSHPRFEHWRGKSSTIKRRRYAKFRWLAADANVAPNYTLDCVEDIVTYKTSQIEGLLLTLKLSSYDLADHMSQYLERVRSWGYDQISVRQLATNRRECCLAAYRSP